MGTTDNADMPTIASTALHATTGAFGTAGDGARWIDRPWPNRSQRTPDFEEFFGRIAPYTTANDYDEEEEDMAETKIACRIVKVFIADPDEKLELNDRLLFSGEEQLTDATDEELFFEIDPPVKSLLDKHNEKRKKTKDKKVKNKTAYLEPIRIKDLVMTVVTLAEFPAKA